VGTEDIFKQTTGNDSLHKTSNGNGVVAVNFDTSINLVVRSTMFPHHKIHKYTWTHPDVKTHKQTDHAMTDRRRQSSILDIRFLDGLTVILTITWCSQTLGEATDKRTRACLVTRLQDKNII
jgi:hypothetical protein